ncbi:SH3 domain-containing protein [Streptomyces sp. NPDC050161]|uniref:SH3 domain-containing protein n=1 Tax=Streptomyces sp. NPDC050161 TaxID=3365604 RepID=UPI0037AE7E37
MKVIKRKRGLRTLAVVAGAVLAAGLGIGSANAADGGHFTNKPHSETSMANGLNFRAGPNTGYSALGLLYVGDEMEIITFRDAGPNQWDKVRLLRRSAGGLPAGSVGWVKQSYLTAPTCSPGPEDQCLLFGGG